MTCRQRSGKRKDSAFVKVLGLLTEEVDEVHFEVFLVVELFLAQMIRKKMEQMAVRRSQIWRIRWMWNRNPSELQ